jgi:hypothetical protein
MCRNMVTREGLYFVAYCYAIDIINELIDKYSWYILIAKLMIKIIKISQQYNGLGSKRILNKALMSV